MSKSINRKLSFAQEQKAALLKAMNIEDDVVMEKINLSEEDYNKLINDEIFNNIVKIFRDELEQEKLMARFVHNEHALDAWVRHKLVSMVQILEQDVEYFKDYIHSHRANLEPRDFALLIRNIIDAANVLRQIVGELHKIRVDSESLDIDRTRVGVDAFKTAQRKMSVDDISKVIEATHKRQLEDKD